jgi:hypothetical protein
MHDVLQSPTETAVPSAAIAMTMSRDTSGAAPAPPARVAGSMTSAADEASNDERTSATAPTFVVVSVGARRRMHAMLPFPLARPTHGLKTVGSEPGLQLVSIGSSAVKTRLRQRDGVPPAQMM